MKFFGVIGGAVIMIALGAFILGQPKEIKISGGDTQIAGTAAAVLKTNPVLIGTDPEEPAVYSSTSTSPTSTKDSDKSAPQNKNDLPKQSQMANPPDEIRGLYITGWVAGSSKWVADLIKIAQKNNLNAAVVDVKDYTGEVSYAAEAKEVKESGAAKYPRIPLPNKLIHDLHEAGLYVIARVAVFQDPILAKAHPEWAMQKKDGTLWRDKKGLAWMDAASENVWRYDLAIAKDALGRGFDEVNFDYVRFPSDGSLGQIVYPAWDSQTPKHKVISKFFQYLSDNLPGSRISADLFGMATTDTGDSGIGQVLEDSFGKFDAICPMVYPSHFADGFHGYKNPAKFPYEVIDYSMSQAKERMTKWLDKVNSATTTSKTALRTTYLRPWLQVFDLGAVYDKSMVEKQIKATEDALAKISTSTSKTYGGYLLWDPKNTYLPIK